MKIERKEGLNKIKLHHNKKLFYAIIILIIVLIFLIASIINNKNKDADTITPVEKECMIDSECVKECGCHVSKCIPLAQRGKCEMIFCTQECSGPLDCGAGHCGCVNNKCEIVNDNV